MNVVIEERSCRQPVRGYEHVGGAECELPKGHKGYHSGRTFTCDGCGNTYRGEPYKSGGTYFDPEAGIGLCFLCVKEGQRKPYDYD